MNRFRKLLIDRDVLDEVISHCKEEFPLEACGILAGRNNIVSKIYKTTNIEKTSFSYQIDPKEQLNIMKDIQNKGLKMLCIYHSHPYSAPYPSAKDIKLAFYDDIFYMIIGFQMLSGKTFEEINNEIKVFTIKEGKIDEIKYRIINDENFKKNQI